MKKIIALLLVFGMSGALLAGCGESTSESNNENSNNNNTSVSATESDIPSATETEEPVESEENEESAHPEPEEPSPSFVERTLKTVTESLPDGTVTSITEYDEQGNKISYEEFSNIDGIIHSATTIYNSNGQEVDYYYGAISSDGECNVTQEFLMEYNDAGNLIRYTEIEYSPSYDEYFETPYEILYDEYGNKIDSDATYTYDENGNITSEKTSKQYYEYSYNSDGQVDIEKEYNYNIVLQSWTQYEYDSEGRVIKESVYGSDDTLDYTREYTYDQFGNVVRQVKIDNKGKETPELERTYDYCNNITYEKDYTKSTVKNYYTCEYTYDDAGNMTQKILQDGDGKTTYTYVNEYYD